MSQPALRSTLPPKNKAACSVVCAGRSKTSNPARTLNSQLSALNRRLVQQLEFGVGGDEVLSADQQRRKTASLPLTCNGGSIS
jgi:hypothetical protein